MRRLILPGMALWAALAIASSSAAQNNPAPGAAVARPAGAIYGSVTEADLRALVLAEGHALDKMHPFDSPSVRGKTKDGVMFVLVDTACDQNAIKRCQGIMMQVRYDADDRATDQGMAEANLAQAAITSWWDKEQKTVGFTRYVVLDDGVTWMNIRQNLRVLLAVHKLALKKIWPN